MKRIISILKKLKNYLYKSTLSPIVNDMMLENNRIYLELKDEILNN